VQINGKFKAEVYINILETVFLPSVRARFPEGPIFFIHDRSPIHTAIVVREWFRQHPEITVLDWPSKGADMNPIENVWGDMVKCFEGRRARNRDEVFEMALALWEHFKIGRPEYWSKLARSMVNRLQLVIEAEGYWTKY